MLCDPSSTLIGAIGLKKAPNGTQRGVFAVDKQGKVLLCEPGGPAATANAVKALVGSAAGGEAKEEPAASKVADETKATNGDDITEKAPEEAVKEPVEVD